MSSFDIVSEVLRRHGVGEDEIYGGRGPDGNPDGRPYGSLVNYAAKETGLDPELIHAVIKVESGYDPAAVSPKGAMGLMQLMPDTARELGVKNAHDPAENILAGARYLSKLIEANGGSVEKGLWAYNAGQKRVQQGILPAETEQYIARVKGIAGGEDPLAQESYDARRGMVPAEEVVRRVLLQRLQPKPTTPEVISAAPPDTLLDKLKGFFQDQEEMKAQAGAIDALAAVSGRGRAEIEADPALREKLTSEIFGARDVKDSDYYNFLMNAAVAGGILPIPAAAGGIRSHIWPTLKAIAGFTGLGEAESALISAATGQPYEFLNQRGLSELLPEGAGKNVVALTEAIDFVAKGAALGFAGRKLGARWDKMSEPFKEKYLRERMESVAPGATIEIPAQRLRDYFTRGSKAHDAEFYNMMQDIGIPEGQARNAVLNGLTIELPATKLVKVADKPWWGKLKRALDIDPYARVTAEVMGPAKARVSEVKGPRLAEPEPQVIHPLRDEIRPEAPLAPERERVWTEQPLESMRQSLEARSRVDRGFTMADAPFILKGEPYSKDFTLKEIARMKPEDRAKLDELLRRRAAVAGPEPRKLLEGPEAEAGRKLEAQRKAYEEALAASVGRVQPTSAERAKITRLLEKERKEKGEKLAGWAATGGEARKGIEARLSNERYEEAAKEALGSLPEIAVPQPPRETLNVVKNILREKPPEVSRETEKAPASTPAGPSGQTKKAAKEKEKESYNERLRKQFERTKIELEEWARTYSGAVKKEFPGLSQEAADHIGMSIASDRMSLGPDYVTVKDNVVAVSTYLKNRGIPSGSARENALSELRRGIDLEKVVELATARNKAASETLNAGKKKVAPEVVKDYTRAELDELADRKFAKSFAELTATEKRKLAKEHDEVIHSTAISETELVALAKDANYEAEWKEKWALASDKSGQYASDGHWLIINKTVAQQMRDKYWEKREKEAVNFYKKKNPELSHKSAVESAKSEIAKERKEYDPPNYEAFLPKDQGRELRYAMARLEPENQYAFFVDASGRSVGVNASYLKLIRKHFPDAKVSQIEDVKHPASKPLQFRVNGELKALLMPVRVEVAVPVSAPAGTEKYATRTPWTPETAKATVHTSLNKLKSHRDYAAAKSGDAKAAYNLVRDLMSPEKIRALAKKYEGRNVVIYPINAIEAGGINQIPLAMAAYISELTGWPVNTDVIQKNIVHHIGATAMERLMRQPEFGGKVTGELAVIVDDVTTTGSTLAGLKGYLENNGATVIGIHAMAQGTFGSNLKISLDTLGKLKENFKHDLPAVLETIYGEKVPPEGLTESEARTINANRDVLIERARAGKAPSAPERGAGGDATIHEESAGQATPVSYVQTELPGIIDPLDRILNEIIGIIERNPLPDSIAESQEAAHKAIRAAFPSAEIGPAELLQTERGPRWAFMLTMPNGTKVLVDWKSKIIINPVDYKAATGKDLRPGVVAAASWRQVGPHGILTYTDLSSPADTHHEAFHAAWDLVMTDGERKRLEEEFGSEEAAAEDYGNWAHEQAGKRERRERQTWLQNLYQRIRNFFQRLKEFFFPSFRTVYDKVSSGKIWERTARRDATEAGKTIFRDAADYAIRNFSGEKEVSVPAITDAIMASRPITKAMAQEFVRQARRAGVSEAGIRKAVEKFQQYNEIRKIGNFALLPKIEPSQVVIREGVLNTPAVTGIRRERLDKILYPAIREGKASAETGRLIEGGVERTAIPETARGLEPQVFLNLPITQPDLSRPRPANLSYPLMVTGNPHLTNFKRPDPSWDSVIRAVRVKPVLNGSPEVTRAVAKAINYAREIGAHVLITTYRAKHPWSLARFTNFVPTDPKHPEFGDWWIENPRPRGEDPRTWMDWTPWVPRKPDAMAALFRANGWDTAKNLYGPSSYNVLTIVNSRKKGLQGFKTREEAEAYLSSLKDEKAFIEERGGTWWWPTSRQLDAAVLDLIEPGPIEYCDLFHDGCPSYRNCQHLTYPDAAGAPIVGVTDEPFCEMGCPQCFVRLGNSGTRGRKGISMAQNAKQKGFGKPDLGDYYPQTIQILQGVARPSGSGLVDVSASFLKKSPVEQVELATSLLVSSAIKPKEHVTIVDEVLRAASDGLLELDPPAKYATRKPAAEGAPLSGTSLLRAWNRIKRGITVAPQKDISVIEELWHNPWFLSKKPGEEDLARLVSIELERNKSRTKAIHEDLEAVKPVFDLRGKKLDLLIELIWKLDGKQLQGVTASRFVWGKNAEGRPGIRALNQEHFDQMKAALEKTKYKDIADVYVALRKGLDRSLAKAFNAQSRMKDIEDSVIERLRKSIGQIPNYFPHVRYGNWSIRGYDAEGKIVYRSHYYDTPKVSTRGERLLAKIKPQYPEAVEWKIAPVTKLPDEIYDYPIPIEAMEQVIYAAAERVGDPAARQLFEKAMPEAIADVIKSRGWGAHMIRRRDIPGHEKRDIKRILHEYFAGLNGWLTKMEASRKHSEVLRDLRAKKEPRRWKYASDYVRDALSNADRLDAAADTLRTAIYVKYLAGVIKSGVVNLTQNVVAAVPRMSIDARWAGAMYLSAARKAIVGAITKGKRLSADELRVVTELVLEGVASDQFNQEIKGRIGTRIGNTLNRAVDVLGLTMALPERFNRISTGLAAYRIAKDGKIVNPDTLKRYGMEKGKPWPYEKAKAYAEEIVNDTHFVMGKANLPTWARGPSVGAKFGRSAYALQSFSHQYLQLLGWMAKQRRGYRAIMRSLLALLILGGISSLPFFGTISRISRRMLGRDPESAAREMVPESTGANRNLWRDLVVYGAPAALGVDISGSLSIEFHNPDNPVASLVGVPYSILIDDPAKAIEAYQYGDASRAVEAMAPRFIANAVAAARLYGEGAYTISGQPLTLPGESEARRISLPEAIGKAAGLQPLSSSKAWDINEKIEDLTKFVAAKRAKWASRYANAQRDGNQKEMDAVRNEVEAWNARVISEGRPQLVVRLADALRERGRPRQPAKPMRGLAQELKGLYE